jgi:hypothetical protein
LSCQTKIVWIYCANIRTQSCKNSEVRMARSLLSSMYGRFYSRQYQIHIFEHGYPSIQFFQSDKSSSFSAPKSPFYPAHKCSVPLFFNNSYYGYNHTISSSSTYELTLRFHHIAGRKPDLNHMIESAEPLPTPARKFVRSLTSAAEKIFTCTSILQEYMEAQEALLTARQH